MTRNIQRIEKKGLINRAPNLSDKRSINLQLSKRGKQISQLLNEQISEHLSSVFQKYNFEQIEDIRNMLESLGWELYLYRKNL